MSDRPTRLIVRASLASIEHLLAEEVLVRATAPALRFECSDATINNRINKYASTALAQRIIGAKLAWPASIESLTAALQQAGIKHDRAFELASLLGAENTIRHEAEVPSDRTAVEAIAMYVNANPYISVDCRLVDQPAPEPAAPPIEAATPPHENEVAEGTWPIPAPREHEEALS